MPLLTFPVARLRRLLGTAATLALAAGSVGAQQADAPSMLIADQVEILSDGKLVASGNVEAMQGDAHLKAPRITYDPDAETLQIDGPIYLQEGENTSILADSAELSTDLTQGLMRSARVVLDQQLQINAVEMNRVNGRYTQLYNVVASSCEVCAAHPVPVWQIRARRVIHDQEEKQIHFRNATLDVVGVPVFYLPYFRIPDPTLDRASGFLTPSFQSGDDLGFGVKLPYFFAIDPHKDLTLTPYLAAGYTETLEMRYRQAFRKGYVEMNGAVSQDGLREGGLRAYGNVVGYFALPKDFSLSFDIEAVSDDDYLNDYDYLGGKDRLDSAVTLQRVKRDKLFVGEIILYKSLRSEDDSEMLPSQLADLTWQQRIQPPVIGGIASFGVELHGHKRRSEINIEGRDVARFTGFVDWQRDWVGPAGLLFGVQTVALFDQTGVAQDNTYDSPISQFVPIGAAELRWPWVRNGAYGSQVIEPVIQLVWSRKHDKSTPNDESTQLEFDSGNLFALSRFPALDQYEEGFRANVGLSWTRFDAAGWSMGATVGRILRSDDYRQFDGYEIFENKDSDWLAELRFDLANRITLNNRATFDNSFKFNRNELRLGWDGDGLDVATSFVWLEPSLTEYRYDRIREWRMEAGWDVNDRLTTLLDWRYDMVLDRSASTRVGFAYQTECVDFDFVLRRRYTEYNQDQPKTDFAFQVDLAGIGGAGGGHSRPRRLACWG